MFRILALRQALKLEIQGIKVIRGQTAYSIIKQATGWKGSREAILAKMDVLRDAIIGESNEDNKPRDLAEDLPDTAGSTAKISQ